MRKSIFLLSVVLILGLVIGGCVAPTSPGAAPEQPAATEAAAEEAAPAGPFEPMVYAAENCDYGGLFKSMEAVDEKTVKFTLCYPDVAFPVQDRFLGLRHQ
jgi:peptide/nickel transport system substrate-binding protein